MAPRIEKAQKDACGGDGAVQACPLSSKITVTLRMALFNAGEGESFFHGIGIPGATFKIDGAARGPATKSKTVNSGLPPTVEWAPGLKNRSKMNRQVGLAEIPVGDLADGDHLLEIDPPPGQTSSGPAGAAMTDPGANKNRYRTIVLRVTFKAGKIVAAPVILAPEATVTYVHVVAWDASAIAIDWKPDWAFNVLATPARHRKLTLLIIHTTDHADTGTPISGAYNQAQTSGPHGWHYLIDHDGHALKFLEEKDATWNAAPAVWKGDNGVNFYGAGIELIPFPNAFGDAQYVSLIRILKEIAAAHDIPLHRVVGHSDVDVADGDRYQIGSGRTNDPGPGFEWERLEAAGLGMMPKPGHPRNEGWAAYFASFTEPLRSGDKDAAPRDKGHKKVWKKWGAVDRTESPLTDVIRGLQADLLAIGYSVAPPDGVFSGHLASAIRAFKRHFLTGTRGPFPGEISTLGTVDEDTAWLVQAVAAFVREADLKAEIAAAEREVAKTARKVAGAVEKAANWISGGGGAPPAGAAPPGAAPSGTPPAGAPPGSK